MGGIHGAVMDVHCQRENDNRTPMKCCGTCMWYVPETNTTGICEYNSPDVLVTSNRPKCKNFTLDDFFSLMSIQYS